jgi:hypothetical protein
MRSRSVVPEHKISRPAKARFSILGYQQLSRGWRGIFLNSGYKINGPAKGRQRRKLECQ